MTVGDLKLDYVAGGRLNPNGDISLPGHRQATSDPTMQVVAGILAFSAIVGLFGPKVGSSSSDFAVSDQMEMDRIRANQRQNDREVGCMMAGNDPILQGIAGGC